MNKTLEEIVSEEVIKFIESELSVLIKEKKRSNMIYIIGEILSEYAEDWAKDNAHDWMIDHAP